MDKPEFLNISKYNMNQFIKSFDSSKACDILLNISDNYYFINTLASLIYMQSNDNLSNKIIIAPAVAESASYFIIDDEYCKRAGFIYDRQNNVSSLEFFQEYKKSYFYLKTSGSTGEPVLIKKYIYQMINEAKCIQNLLGSDFTNKNVCSIVPHHHMYGMTFAVFMPIVLNFPVAERSPLLENLSQLEENILITSPEFLKKVVLYNKNYISDEFRNIELIITAGSILDDNIRLALNNITNAKILNIYGSTETGIIAYDVGQGFYLFDSVVIKNINGENEIISDWSMPYTLKDNIVLNGNKLEIHGRNDRVVKIADKRFSLDMVETYIKNSDLIYDAYAYVVNNRIGALISLTEKGKSLFKNAGKKGVVEDIEKYTSNTFGNNLRYYKIVANIVRNENGKLLKKENDDLIHKHQELEFIQEKVEKDEDNMTALFSAYVREDIQYFPFHFYSFPLVPGFIELDYIVKLAEKFGYDFSKINKISNLKFSSFIRPCDNMKVELIMSSNLVKFNIYTDVSKSASGSIKYGV